MCVCVCVCVRARACMRMCVYVCVCARMWGGIFLLLRANSIYSMQFWQSSKYTLLKQQTHCDVTDLMHQFAIPYLRDACLGTPACTQQCPGKLDPGVCDRGKATVEHGCMLASQRDSEIWVHTGQPEVSPVRFFQPASQGCADWGEDKPHCKDYHSSYHSSFHGPAMAFYTCPDFPTKTPLTSYNTM